MRTTLTLDDDVLEKARRIANRSRKPFRCVVNEALRAGLASADGTGARPYRTHARAMKLRAGRDLDNVQELLAQVEGEAHR